MGTRPILKEKKSIFAASVFEQKRIINEVEALLDHIEKQGFGDDTLSLMALFEMALTMKDGSVFSYRVSRVQR